MRHSGVPGGGSAGAHSRHCSLETVRRCGGKPSNRTRRRKPLADYPLALSVASRAASLAPPAALWAEPLALSILPSACVLVSPVAEPTASFTAPLALLAAPETRSLSMVAVLRFGPARLQRGAGLQVGSADPRSSAALPH